MKLSDNLIDFIKNTPWLFAKTYADTWIHEYIIQEKVDNYLFLQLAKHIDIFGHEEYFYKKKMTYFDYYGHLYWHMENFIMECRMGYVEK
ncbi:MAG: hypothetical protein GQ531_01245 [Sulfurovum sp.]|nr:hypothetical protein [Sulfurovum sp.]